MNFLLSGVEVTAPSRRCHGMDRDTSVNDEGRQIAKEKENVQWDEC